MKNEKKNILVLSLFIPPSAEIGAKRFCFLSNVLQNKFSVSLVGLPVHYYSQCDFSLSTNAAVSRAPMFPFFAPFPWKRQLPFLKKALAYLWSNYLCIIDIFSGWIIPVVIKGLMLHKKTPFDAIIVTGPPFSPMCAGYILSCLTGAKLILDYRDPWTRTHEATREYPRLFGKQLNYALEGIVFKRASAAVFVSRIMENDFKGFFDAAVHHKCYCLTNGFFPSKECQAMHLEKGKKVILYQGRFYGGKNMWMLLEALHDLIHDNVFSGEDVRVHMFGEPLPAEDREAIEKHGMKHLVVEHEYVAYTELQKYMAGADILYLPSGTGVFYTIPGKFFEYLSVRKPILAVAPRGSEIEHMMNAIDCGEFADIDRKESIKNVVAMMLKGGKRYSFNGCENYTWDQIAKNYAQLLSSVLKG